MNIDIVFQHGKELTAYFAQTAENNVWVRECWLAGLCERKFSVKYKPLRRTKCFVDICQKSYLYLDEELKLSNQIVNKQ